MRRKTRLRIYISEKKKRERNRVLSFVLCICLVSGLIGSAPFIDKWTGLGNVSAGTIPQGSVFTPVMPTYTAIVVTGTPTAITNAAQFASIGMTSVVAIEANFTLPTTFPGLGTTGAPFSGTIIGSPSGVTIRLQTSYTDSGAGVNPDATGLIRYAQGASILDLNVDGDIYIEYTGANNNPKFIGTLVGRAYNSATKIVRSNVDVDIKFITGPGFAVSGNADVNIGGVVGSLESGSILDDIHFKGTLQNIDSLMSKNTTDISNTFNVGGLVGKMTGILPLILNSSTDYAGTALQIQLTGIANMNIGGLVGLATGASDAINARAKIFESDSNSNILAQGLYSASTNIYVSGLVGNASYTEVVSCKAITTINSYNNGKVNAAGLIGVGSYINVANATANIEGHIAASTNNVAHSAAAYAAGAVAEVTNLSRFENVNVNFSSTSSQSSILAFGYKNVFAGGLIGQMTAVEYGYISGCSITNTAGKSADISATTVNTTANPAYSGGIVGNLTGAALFGLINNSVGTAGETINITAKDNGSTNAAPAYAGGHIGRMENTVYADNATSMFFKSGTKSFAGNVNVIANISGMGAGHAGGISGYNICYVGGEIIDLSGVSVTVNQGASATGNANIYAGGLTGYLQSLTNHTLEYITIKGISTKISVKRYAPSIAYGEMYVGGMIPQKEGTTGIIKNISVDFKNSEISARQESYNSRDGSALGSTKSFVAVGALVGVAINATISDIDVKATGTTNITATQNGNPNNATVNEHGRADAYVGGVIGGIGLIEAPALNSAGSANNIKFTGEKDAIGNGVYLYSGNSANSPSIGGGIGYALVPVSNLHVKNARIYGEGFNDKPSNTDTDIIVGGAVGLFSHNYGRIANAKVEGSIIEANGKHYTLTYAGGILGSQFGGSFATGTPLINNCVSEGNQVIATGQKKWAASGGILGYHFSIGEPNYISINNCASIDDILIADSLGGRTVVGSTYFYGESMAGGIIGKINEANTVGTNYLNSSTNYTRLDNCYSNAKLVVTNSEPEHAYRGGLIGQKKSTYSNGSISLDNVLIYNSFFHKQNAGTSTVVDSAYISTAVGGTTPKGGTPNSGQPTVTNADGIVKNGDYLKAGKENITKNAPLDFSQIVLFGVNGSNTAKADILTGLKESIVNGETSVKVEPPSTTLFAINSASSGTDYLSSHSAVKLTNGAIGTGAAVATVMINGNSYVLGKKPIAVIDDLPTPMAITLSAITTGGIKVTITTDTSVSYNVTKTEVYSYEAELAYDGADVDKFPSLIDWEFYDITEGVSTVAVQSGALSKYADISVDGDKIHIRPNVPVEYDKIFAFEAHPNSKLPGLDFDGGRSHSYKVTVTIKPTYPTGIAIIIPPEAQGEDVTTTNAIGTYTNPIIVSLAETIKVLAQIYPDDATKQGYNIAGYKTTLGGIVITSPALTGVKSDGTVFANQLTASPDNLRARTSTTPGDIFCIIATSVGKDASGAALVSEPVYYRISTDLNVTVFCDGGSAVYNPKAAYKKSYSMYSTRENNMSGMAKELSYTVGANTYYLISNSAIISDASIGTITYNSATGRTSITIPAEKMNANLSIYINYIGKIAVNFYPKLGSNESSFSKDISPILTQEIKDDVMATLHTTTEYKIKEGGYQFSGWYANANKTTLQQYGYNFDVETRLPVIWTQDGSNLVAQTVNLYARWQYKVDMLYTPGGEIICNNVAVGETYSRTAPINDLVDFQFKLLPSETLSAAGLKFFTGNRGAVRYDVEYNGSDVAHTFTASTNIGVISKATFDGYLYKTTSPYSINTIAIKTYHTDIGMYSYPYGTLGDVTLNAQAATPTSITNGAAYVFKYVANHMDNYVGQNDKFSTASSIKKNSSTFAYAESISAAALSAAGIKDAGVDNLHIYFKEPLASGSEVRLYRTEGNGTATVDSKNRDVPNSLYYYTVGDDETATNVLTLGAFTEMGRINKTAGITITENLFKKAAFRILFGINEITKIFSKKAYPEEFYVVIEPPEFSTKQAINEITFGYPEISTDGALVEMPYFGKDTALKNDQRSTLTKNFSFTAASGITKPVLNVTYNVGSGLGTVQVIKDSKDTAYYGIAMSVQDANGIVLQYDQNKNWYPIISYGTATPKAFEPGMPMYKVYFKLSATNSAVVDIKFVSKHIQSGNESGISLKGGEKVVIELIKAEYVKETPTTGGAILRDYMFGEGEVIARWISP